MQILSNDKIRIFESSVIVAATGSVGYTQRLHAQIAQAVSDRVFTTMDRRRCANNISDRFLRDLQSSSSPSHPHHGIGFGAVIASAVEKKACLIEFSTNTFQPEFKEGRLFYVSMGSGQTLADPFLAFVARVLWKDDLPDIQMGKLGVYWALNHTISLAPGMVGFPIKIAYLQRQDGQWIAQMAEDIQETAQYVKNLEAKISSQTITSIAEALGKPLPVVPDQNEP